MRYIEGSEERVGCRVKAWTREAFSVTGYTLIVPPGAATAMQDFRGEVASDGRLDRLRSASSIRPWVLGLGSWDPECEAGGQRYTVCIEETCHTDFAELAGNFPLFRMAIGASEWLCFETTQEELDNGFADRTYEMMGDLGYRFHSGDYSVGLHFDAYPPAYDNETRPAVEFWITVVKE